MAQTMLNLVAADDASLRSDSIQFPGPHGDVRAYLSRPKADGPCGAVLVIHENKGLNDHIRDVARRLAKEGFAALAIDLLSRVGGSERFTTPEAAVDAIKSLKPDGVVADFDAALDYLRRQPFANQRVGVVGFCWGGAQALNFATHCPTLNAAVVYYGRNPEPLERVRNIACPLLGKYAEDDPNILPGVEPLKQALTAAGKSVDIKVYAGAKHALNNNTNAERYHPQAAQDAWLRTTRFFEQQLNKINA